MTFIVRVSLGDLRANVHLAHCQLAIRAMSLLSNDLVLSIGLPLVAALSLREFACVLAHEFGHCKQVFLHWQLRSFAAKRAAKPLRESPRDTQNHRRQEPAGAPPQPMFPLDPVQSSQRLA